MSIFSKKISFYLELIIFLYGLFITFYTSYELFNNNFGWATLAMLCCVICMLPLLLIGTWKNLLLYLSILYLSRCLLVDVMNINIALLKPVGYDTNLYGIGFLCVVFVIYYILFWIKRHSNSVFILKKIINRLTLHK